jgi:hypothetical protein
MNIAIRVAPRRAIVMVQKQMKKMIPSDLPVGVR